MPDDSVERDDDIETVFRATLAEATSDVIDDEAYWEAVSRVQRRDAHEVWVLIEPLASNPDPRVRALVPDVVRFLGGSSRPLAAQSVTLMARMLECESSPSVLQAIGYALGELGDSRSVSLMIPFARHADPDVRHSVVGALLRQRDPQAVNTLIALSSDEDDTVRDWATFGLGTQLGPTDPDAPSDDSVVDTPALREALVARLGDPHDDTRAEAIVGLAMRRDPRALPVLRQAIADRRCGTLELEAARWYAAPDLCEGLRRFAASPDGQALRSREADELREAIAACCRAVPDPPKPPGS